MFLSNPFTHDSRVHQEAKALIQGGHEVSLIAWDRKKQNLSRESIEGIEVIRLQNTKFMDFLHYDIFRWRYWCNEAYKKALELHEDNPFQVVHCHDLDTLPIGIRLKRKLKLSLIYDAHEIWGHMISRDIPQWWANRFFKLEKKLAPEADRVITVAEPHESYFLKMGCKKVTLVRSCKIVKEKEYIPPDNEKFTLIYIGGLNETRFIEEAVEVCLGLNDIRFRIAGFGVLENKLRDISEKDSSGTIEFIGKMPMKKVIPETARGDAILCMLDPSNMNNKIGPPNKVFEAMVVSRPVIATKGTYSGNLVEKSRMGLAIGFNKKSFENAILKLRDSPELRTEFGKNALKAALEEYNWAVQEEVLLRTYKSLIEVS